MTSLHKMKRGFLFTSDNMLRIRCLFVLFFYDQKGIAKHDIPSFSTYL